LYSSKHLPITLGQLKDIIQVQPFHYSFMFQPCG